MNSKKQNKSICSIIIGICLLISLWATYNTFFGITYLYKYLNYDYHTWGEIKYVSDYIKSGEPYPEHINIQVILDEPVNGEEIYSITFNNYESRQDNITHKGQKVLVMYNDFYNSDGDVISKWDITESIIGVSIIALEIIVMIIAIFVTKLKNNKERIKKNELYDYRERFKNMN